MKKTNVFLWLIVIIGSMYIISMVYGSFDTQHIDARATQFLGATSSPVFYFDGNIYDPAFLPHDMQMIRVGDHDLFVKMVSDESSRARGLSGVDGMDDNVGMLFVFDVAAQHGFWMKDMKFPIDIVWIGEDMHIVDISEQFSPESYPEVIRPIAPARYVLEINAGIARKNGFSKGDSVVFSQ